MGVQRVVICGVQTPNCIRGTAWDAIALDYPQVRAACVITACCLLPTCAAICKADEHFACAARTLQVTVLSDGTASASAEVQEANLHDMRHVKIDTPTVAEWAAQHLQGKGAA